MNPNVLAQVVERLRNSHPDQAEPAFGELLAGADKAFFSHVDFCSYYKRIDTDFIFDGKSGVYLAGVMGSHVDLLAQLWRYHGGQEKDKYLEADLFVSQGLGMFKSRAGHRIMVGQGFIITDEMQTLKRDLEIVK